MDDEVSKTLLQVNYNTVNEKYFVKLAAGSSVAETAFCMAIVIKCLLRDKVVKNSKDVLNLIKKYINDPQYSELKEEN